MTEEEGVAIDFLTGHGGYFKSGTAGRIVMSETVGVPIRLMAHSSEGGAWGMAVLAAYLDAQSGRPLVDFVHSIFAGQGRN